MKQAARGKDGRILNSMCLPKDPRFKEGQTVNGFLVLERLEHGPREFKEPRWWYRVQCQCGCGKVEEVNQSQLAKRKRCQSRANELRSLTVRLGPQVEEVETLPDSLRFERLRFTDGG